MKASLLLVVFIPDHSKPIGLSKPIASIAKPLASSSSSGLDSKLGVATSLGYVKPLPCGHQSHFTVR